MLTTIRKGGVIIHTSSGKIFQHDTNNTGGTLSPSNNRGLTNQINTRSHSRPITQWQPRAYSIYYRKDKSQVKLSQHETGMFSFMMTSKWTLLLKSLATISTGKCSALMFTSVVFTKMVFILEASFAFVTPEFKLALMAAHVKIIRSLEAKWFAAFRTFPCTLSSRGISNSEIISKVRFSHIRLHLGELEVKKK